MMLATVKKEFTLVAVPALVPVTISSTASLALLVPTILNVIAGEPAVTFPSVEADAVMLEIFRNKSEPVATPAFAPVISSLKTAPSASVPTTVKVIDESLPTEVIVTFSATVCVTDAPNDIAPLITKAVLPVTD